MRHGPGRFHVGLFTLLLTAQMWTLWSSRSAWLGHWPLTSLAVVAASQWPGIVLAGVGVLLVLLPRLRNLEDYHLTAVRSERSLTRGGWQPTALTSVAASVCTIGAAAVATGRSHGFGSLLPGMLVLAVVWPQVGLLAGVAAGLALPRRLRMAALVVVPLTMFYALVGAARMQTGPITELSPINAVVVPGAAETAFTTWLRVAVWSLVLLTLACVTWVPRLRWWSTFLLSAAVTLSVIALPQTAEPIPGAETITCSPGDTRLCWYAWGDAGSATFTRAIEDMASMTPAALRPDIVLGGDAPDARLPDAMLIGYPGGTALLAPWPDEALIRQAYARRLVSASCPESQAGPFLTVRIYRAFGMDPDQRLRSWDRTEADLSASATPDERALLHALNGIDDEALFGLLLDARSNPAMCGWTLPHWTTEMT